jgi:hypothetical protein
VGSFLAACGITLSEGVKPVLGLPDAG